MQNEYVINFYHWFVNKLGKESYKKIGVDHLVGMIDDIENDLVLVINRRRNILEVESNYFDGGHAEFSLNDIGVLYEKHRQLS